MPNYHQFMLISVTEGCSLHKASSQPTIAWIQVRNYTESFEMEVVNEILSASANDLTISSQGSQLQTQSPEAHATVPSDMTTSPISSTLSDSTLSMIQQPFIRGFAMNEKLNPQIIWIIELVVIAFCVLNILLCLRHTECEAAFRATKQSTRQQYSTANCKHASTHLAVLESAQGPLAC
jgi:hypothetical protein